MKEIGGYLQLDTYYGEMLHENAVKVNCGRNALAYVIEANHIKKIVMPKFLCDSCNVIFEKYNVKRRTYNIDNKFKPVDVSLQNDEWIYIVNYYGQLTNDYICELQEKYQRIIADYSHSYFQMPSKRVDTLYTCRKYFGVSDGAILYSNIKLNRELAQDQSYHRMIYLFGRYEKTAAEFYKDYVWGEEQFKNEPLKKMSKITENMLRRIDYKMVKEIRTRNFQYLDQQLGTLNKLDLIVPEGAFMYPLYINEGVTLRKLLQRKKIYIPCLWPNVLDECSDDELEYDLAMNILPLPVDQRYTIEDMQYVINAINACL